MRKTSSDKQSARPKGAQVEQMLCAGFGGQGIMFMGKLLAESGLALGKHVTWMPSYGAEVRGGTAYSMTKISSAEIASPVVNDPDVLVVMNKPSLVKYGDRVKPGGLMVANRSLIDEPCRRRDISVLNIPMTDIASKLGNIRCANMVAVGAITKRSKTLSIRIVLAALKDMLKGKDDLYLLNKAALEAGHRL